MRQFNKNIISAGDSLNTSSAAIDTNQTISCSFHAYFGDTNAAGTFKLQASNDVTNLGYDALTSGYTPTNWVDIPTQTATIAAGASALLTITQSAYRWIRAVYTNTAAGVQTVLVRADVSGNLNNTYFLLSNGGNSINYYVWFNVNSAGTDPALPGKTGIEVDLATNDSAATVGAAIATAVAAAHATADFTTSGTTTVTITNKVAGQFTPAANGAVTPGFTFTVTVGGSTTVNVNMNSLSI